jgi:hypothetical protein
VGSTNGGNLLAGIEVRQKGVRICLIKDQIQSKGSDASWNQDLGLTTANAPVK